MPTNLQIDDQLIVKAVHLGKHKTKKDAINQAFTDYIHHLEQQQILELFGTIDYEQGYDHKKQRTRR
ncbi:MAG: type II toxin-antitoxin system VapB family antitoxin [Verrucomicrobiota bacterium]